MAGLFQKLNKVILSCRIKLIRFLAGTLSVAVNIATDGNIAIGNGFVYNVAFMRDKAVPKTHSMRYNTRLYGSPSSFVVIDYCVFDNRIYYLKPGGCDKNDGLSYKTAKRTLSGLENEIEPGDTVYCGISQSPTACASLSKSVPQGPP